MLAAFAAAAWLQTGAHDARRLRSAQHALTAGEDGEAFQRLETAGSGDPEVLRVRGLAQLGMGDLRGAQRWLERSVAAAPQYWEAERDLAVVLKRSGRRSAARRAITRAFDLNPAMAPPVGFTGPRRGR